MKLFDTMIAWNPACIRKPHQPWVTYGPHPGVLSGLNGPVSPPLTDTERLEHLFGPFGSLTVAGKVSAEEAHEAFRGIDEYRALVQRSCDYRV